MEQNKYILRRKAVNEKFNSTLFIIPSGIAAKRSHSVNYRFKVHSEFFYLTGLQDEECILILGQKNYLCVPDYDANAVMWGDQDVHQTLREQADRFKDLEIISASQFRKVALEILKNYARVVTPLGLRRDLEGDLLQMLATFHRQKGRIDLGDSRPLTGMLRHIKDADEVKALEMAGQLSSKVHRELMSQKLVGQSEKQICQWIEGHFLLNQMAWASYETIVGSGVRAVNLHARASDKKVMEGELVLIDAGGEWQGYCADITRTIPAAGRFTEKQKEIYNVVLSAQHAVLKNIRPGTSLNDLHQVTLQSLTEGLCQLGFSQDLIKKNRLKLMPHSTSHWIGLDVHDPSAYVDDNGNPIRLQKDMAFTVEPGLYFRDGIHSEFARYLDIGVRIEDDVLVTEAGYWSLTDVPKEVEEIEYLRSQNKA